MSETKVTRETIACLAAVAGVEIPADRRADIAGLLQALLRDSRSYGPEEPLQIGPDLPFDPRWPGSGS